tara:strand:+ start:19505 stop:19918 length:414 start_codon:yes stop_codon:yes gene_type:complete
MKIPLKLEYACRVLIQLRPTYTTGEIRRVENLADREKISPNYLVQILNELRNAGLVESRRGKNGGYVLAQDPEAITLDHIVRAVEGPFLQLNGSTDGESGETTAKLWKTVASSIEDELKKHSLASMGDPGEAGMWMI